MKTICGKYIYFESQKLGKGSEGVVYRGACCRTKAEVAVKLTHRPALLESSVAAKLGQCIPSIARLITSYPCGRGTCMIFVSSRQWRLMSKAASDRTPGS